MGSMLREFYRWEVGIRLEWVPMTRRHLDWIAWSLRLLEEHVELQTWATLVRVDRIRVLCRVTLLACVSAEYRARRGIIHNDASQSVVLLWTRDQLVPKTST